MSDSDGDTSGWSSDASGDTAGGLDGDSFTETTTKSWFSRIGGALVGVLLGLVLIPGGVVLLAWNEGRAVQTARSLSEGAHLVLDVPDDRVDPANEGRLVHVSGPLAGLGAISDPAFGVRVEGATRLRRHVEMYQWKEERHSETRSKLGGGQETVTTYSYARSWSDQAIDSSHFRNPSGHANPPMPTRSQDLVAAQGSIGAFRLDEAELRQLGRFQPLPPDAVPQRAGATPIEGGFQTGDPGAPRLGDLRVTFSVARTDAASIIGQQAGSGFAPFQTRAGDRLLLASDGILPAAEMIRQAEEANTVLTWILRAVGALVVFIGAVLILQPLVVLADIVPLFGSIVGFGTGLVALLVTVVVAPVTIAIAWLWVRPLVGAAVLVAGAGLAFGVARLMRSRKAARLAAAPPARMPGYVPAGHAPPAPPGYAPGGPAPMPPGEQHSSFFPQGWTPPQR